MQILVDTSAQTGHIGGTETQTGETKMNLLNNGMATIKAADVTIIKRYDDAELVAVQHANGFVALYAEDEDDLVQMCSGMKNANMTGVQIADRLMFGK